MGSHIRKVTSHLKREKTSNLFSHQDIQINLREWGWGIPHLGRSHHDEERRKSLNSIFGSMSEIFRGGIPSHTQIVRWGICNWFTFIFEFMVLIKIFVSCISFVEWLFLWEGVKSLWRIGRDWDYTFVVMTLGEIPDLDLFSLYLPSLS